MVNKIIKYFVIFLLLFNISIVYAQEDTIIETNDTSYQSKYKCVIEDDAGLLTEEEEKKLYDEMLPITKYGHIIFKSINYNPFNEKEYASNYYHTHFNKESGTLFLIDMANRQLYIFSDGSNYKIITSNKAYSITDNVYRYATNGKYYDCAREVYKEIYTLLEGNKILEPMRYISNGFIAVIIAAFINFFIVMRKSIIRVSSEEELLKNSTFSIDIKNIDAKKTDERREYRPPSDSGGSSFGGSSSIGGGGSSGGGGGGGSSGGGGGHGF